jgi:glucan-binding YG repeat protein
MVRSKLKILILVMVIILAQGTCANAASSDKKDYTKDELSNRTPGFDKSDIDKSNYYVNSQKNTFSSAQTTDSDDKKDSKSTSTSKSSTATDTVNSNTVNTIVSTVPSTGSKGDFWGKTSSGKWILIEQGVPATGWRNVRGKWYYMDAEGIMQTGWINDGQTWYYLKPNGEMAYNAYIDGYYLDWNGAMQ